MTHREQLAILALGIVLLLLVILFPPPAASDQPVVATAIPAADFRTLTSTTLRAPAPSIAPSASPLPPAATPVRSPAPQAAASMTGTASWFRSPAGVSAAGPALRTALGQGWRGSRVHVTGPAGTATTTLGDWCRCDTSAAPVIDLDAPIFEIVCGALSRGICRVEVSR